MALVPKQLESIGLKPDVDSLEVLTDDEENVSFFGAVAFTARYRFLLS